VWKKKGRKGEETKKSIQHLDICTTWGCSPCGAEVIVHLFRLQGFIHCLNGKKKGQGKETFLLGGELQDLDEEAKRMISA